MEKKIMEVYWTVCSVELSCIYLSFLSIVRSDFVIVNMDRSYKCIVSCGYCCLVLYFVSLTT